MLDELGPLRFPLFTVARRLWGYGDYDDLVQDTYIKAIEHQDGFDGNNLMAWLTKIMRRTRQDQCRDQRVRAEIDAERIYEEFAPENQEEQVFTQEVIVKFNGRSELLALSVLGYSSEEIAEKLDMTISNVRNGINRGKEKVRNAL